jgi:hypothetical protein
MLRPQHNKALIAAKQRCSEADQAVFDMQSQCEGRIEAAVKATRLEMTAQLNAVIQSHAADTSVLNARLLDKIRSVEELSASVADWEAKYATDLAALQRCVASGFQLPAHPNCLLVQRL